MIVWLFFVCFLFYLNQRLQYPTAIPSTCCGGLPFIREIRFLSLACCASLVLLVPFANRGSIQSIPLFYPAVAADTRIQDLDDEEKKRRKIRKEGEEARKKESPRLNSIIPPLSSTRSHTGTHEHERRCQRE